MPRILGRILRHKVGDERRSVQDLAQYKPIALISQKHPQEVSLLDVTSPLCPAAKKLGARWFECSGGELLREEEKAIGVQYEDYVKDVSKLLERDQEQIDKDMARTRPRGLSSPTYREWCAHMNEQETCAALRRVVTSFAKRFHQVGYPQGLDHLAMFLFGFQTEEETFWTLSALLEKIRDRDFYSPPPASLNGFLIQRSLFVDFAVKNFPAIVAVCTKEDFENALEVICAKWFLIAFVDIVRFDCSVLIFDSFMLEGDYGLLRVGCAVLEFCEAEILESKEPLPTLMMHTAQVTPVHIREGLKNPKYFISVADLTSQLATHRQRLAETWTQASGSKLVDLADYAKFTNDQLEKLKELFLQVSKKNTGVGLTPDQFKRLVIETCENTEHVDEKFLDNLFCICDEDGNGEIDFREMTCCLSLLSRGTVEDKLRMCFDCYDTNRDGFLVSDEIAAMSGWLLRILAPGAPENKPEEEKKAVVVCSEQQRSYAKKIALMDADGDGKITFEEFRSWIEGEPLLRTTFALKFEETNIDDMPKEVIYHIRHGEVAKTAWGKFRQVSGNIAPITVTPHVRRRAASAINRQPSASSPSHSAQHSSNLVRYASAPPSSDGTKSPETPARLTSLAAKRVSLGLSELGSELRSRSPAARLLSRVQEKLAP